MRKLLAWMVVVVVFLIVPPVRADPGTLYVDDDGVCAGNFPCYTSIQKAIEAANPGDTVFVYAGTYYECLTIDKALDLQTEDLDTTIINGEDCQDPLLITAAGVTIGAVHAPGIGSMTYTNTEYVDDDGVCNGNTPCHTTIQAGVNAASNGETVHVYAGIYYEHVTIAKPIAVMGEARETTIIDGGGTGNVLYVTSNNVTIGRITVRNGYNGIYLIGNWQIHHFTFTDAIVTANSYMGIQAPHSNDTGAYHLLEDCVISNNGSYGLYAHQFSTSIIRNCEVFGNLGTFALIPAWGHDTLITGNRVHDNASEGIRLDSMYHTTVENNVLWNNEGAIVAGYANGYNTVRENIIHHNGYGLIPDTPGNRIYHNDLIDNTYQGWDNTGANYWDDAYPSGGNYWSDYTGVDNYSGSDQGQPGSDGIGDTSYALHGNQDHYPLMNPWNFQRPVADAGGPYAAAEGDTVTLDASGSSDPDGNIAPYEWDLDNDGEYDDATGVTTNVFFGDNGSFTVGLKVTDEYGLGDADTAEVTILNVAPTLGTIAPDPEDPVVAVDTPVSFSAPFSDPAGAVDEPYSCNFDWDSNGAIDETIETTYGTCNGSHAYGSAGVYTVRLTVTDKDGADSNESIFEFVVAYDPSAGFVTGGGWIWSPVGAYYTDPKLEGKATFGFVSKYQKGANVPTGSTEFQFKAGDLNFHSTSYDWLVVTGSNYARFKGAGTINGEGDYKFMLWAGDGNPDTFRIKIHTEDALGNETVVYDNGFNQAIEGGSIVIHAK
jgi:nitrous oxidase accessory protein NosD